jgi:hypothetical protein
MFREVGTKVAIAVAVVGIVTASAAATTSGWNARLPLTFVRGQWPQGVAVVATSLDGARTAQLRAQDLQEAKLTIWSVFTSTCETEVALVVDTTAGDFRLFADGRVGARDSVDLCFRARDGTTLTVRGVSVVVGIGSAEKELFKTDAGDNYFRDDVTLSPRGDLVAYVGYASTSPAEYFVDVVGAGGGVAHALATTLPALWRKEGLAWSPDGSRLAFWISPAEGVDSFEKRPSWLRGVREAIVVVDRAGRVLSRIPDAARPAWSPDGRRLAFDSARTGRRQIYVARWTGSGIRKVTHSSRGSWGVRWR